MTKTRAIGYLLRKMPSRMLQEIMWSNEMTNFNFGMTRRSRTEIRNTNLNRSIWLAYLFTLLVTSPSNGDSLMKPGILCRTVPIAKQNEENEQRCFLWAAQSSMCETVRTARENRKSTVKVLTFPTFIVVTVYCNVSGIGVCTATQMHVLVLSL